MLIAGLVLRATEPMPLEAPTTATIAAALDCAQHSGCIDGGQAGPLWQHLATTVIGTGARPRQLALLLFGATLLALVSLLRAGGVMAGLVLLAGALLQAAIDRSLNAHTLLIAPAAVAAYLAPGWPGPPDPKFLDPSYRRAIGLGITAGIAAALSPYGVALAGAIVGITWWGARRPVPAAAICLAGALSLPLLMRGLLISDIPLVSGPAALAGLAAVALGIGLRARAVAWSTSGPLLILVAAGVATWQWSVQWPALCLLLVSAPNASPRALAGLVGGLLLAGLLMAPLPGSRPPATIWTYDDAQRLADLNLDPLPLAGPYSEALAAATGALSWPRGEEISTVPTPERWLVVRVPGARFAAPNGWRTEPLEGDASLAIIRRPSWVDGWTGSELRLTVPANALPRRFQILPSTCDWRITPVEEPRLVSDGTARSVALQVTASDCDSDAEPRLLETLDAELSIRRIAAGRAP
ncbi:MAG: hypothetical protein ACI9WU_002582 [Myxococcota bacterium]